MSNSPRYPFPQSKPDDPSYGLLRAWWESLEHDKGERAALRRASSLTEVMLCPAFHRVLRELRLAGFGISELRYPNLAAIVGLVARIKKEPESLASFATRMGQPKTGGNVPTVAELRMRSLLACDDMETLYIQLRRVLALLDSQVRVADLAALIWHWSPIEEKRPNDPRRQMAYDYYAAAPL